jgi:hypothetical protein
MNLLRINTFYKFTTGVNDMDWTYFLFAGFAQTTMSYIDVLPPEKIAFIAYNIGVYESVQKFGNLITSGKITNNTDIGKVAELLSDTSAFYDPDMLSGLINEMLIQNTKSNVIERVTPDQIIYVISQLKASGISLP